MAIPEYPISRIEHYLARANGQNVTPPDPISRIEHYLAGIAAGVPQELLDDVADLKSQLNPNSISEVRQNFTIIPNSEVKSTTGVISESATNSRSDYTELMDCEYVTFSNSYPVNYCFYDSAKTYITGGVVTNVNISRPSNAKYIIFTKGIGGIASVILYLHNIPTTISAIYTELDKRPEEDTSFGKPYIDSSVLLEHVIGVSKFPGNLVDSSECVNNAYVDHTNGNLITGTNYFCTGYIPITAGETYKSNVGRNYAWYNASKEFVSGDLGIAIQSGITAPENAAYIRFTVNKTSDAMSDPYGLYFANVDDYDINVTIPGLVITEVKPWCYGKKINWIGDSIVDGPDFDEQVSSALGLIETDYGINGSTIALAEDGTDGRNALCVRYANMNNDADMIVVSCGTNDFEYAWCPIGTINDPDDGTSNTTFYGALKTLSKGLIDKHPQKDIFFTAPIKRGQAFANGAGGEYTADGVPTTPFSKNKYGKTLMDYADIIKEVCGYYSIPVLDMYRESLLNPHISAQQAMFDSVLTHPNDTGQKIMARRVAGWITQLGYAIDGLA